MPAKRKWTEPTKIVSIRLEPAKLEEIKEVFGGLQAWVDICIEALEETKRNQYKKIKKEKV